MDDNKISLKTAQRKVHGMPTIVKNLGHALFNSSTSSLTRLAHPSRSVGPFIRFSYTVQAEDEAKK